MVARNATKTASKYEIFYAASELRIRAVIPNFETSRTTQPGACVTSTCCKDPRCGRSFQIAAKSSAQDKEVRQVQPQLIRSSRSARISNKHPSPTACHWIIRMDTKPMLRTRSSILPVSCFGETGFGGMKVMRLALEPSRSTSSRTSETLADS